MKYKYNDLRIINRLYFWLIYNNKYEFPSDKYFDCVDLFKKIGSILTKFNQCSFYESAHPLYNKIESITYKLKNRKLSNLISSINKKMRNNLTWIGTFLYTKFKFKNKLINLLYKIFIPVYSVNTKNLTDYIFENINNGNLKIPQEYVDKANEWFINEKPGYDIHSDNWFEVLKSF